MARGYARRTSERKKGEKWTREERSGSISKGYRLERIICFRRDTFVNFVTRVWL